MKKFFVITIFLISLSFSTKSYAEWKAFAGTVDDDVFYFDTDRIRKIEKFIYIWILHDRSKPDKHGYLSEINYRQVDCKLYRYKFLRGELYEKNMGKGNSLSTNSGIDEWIYPLPDTIGEVVLQLVCDNSN